MLHKAFTPLLAALIVISVTSAAVVKPKSLNVKAKEPWELLEALSATSSMRGFNGTWLTDNELYYTASDRSIRKFNAASNSQTIFVPSAILATYGPGSTFTVSPDNKKILIRYNVDAIFRHSYVAQYDVFDLETSTPTKIHNGTKLQHCAWSPLQDRLAYVFENNVFIHFEDGTEKQLTTSGVTGVIYNGIADWVYEEEVLSTSSALWWSPDGFKLAVGSFDDTNVSTFRYAMYGDAEDPANQYPREENLKYPKPGTANPIVSLRVYDIIDATTPIPNSVLLTAPVNIVSNDHIMQHVVWSNNSQLLITWLNRRQNLGSLQYCSAMGQCREVLRLQEPNGWIKLSTPICLKSGNNCIFRYWIGDWHQVWNLNLQTGQNVWQSRGDFTVTNLYGYDEQNNNLFYQATLRGEPYVNHVFQNNECLTCNLRDVDDQLCRNAAASFSKNFSYYTVSCTGPGPTYTLIYETKTKSLVKEWELNVAFRQRIASKLMPIVRFMNVTLADGSTSVVRLRLPPNFDESKKYPMIVNVYGGPDSVRVNSVFTVGFDAYITTARGVIYATIDGRGTGNKGKKFLFSVNNILGSHEIEDQIFVTKVLQRFSYVDRERTGIWGWSYGGYVTAKTLADDTERIFQCGIAVAPVTSWLYYDSIYTERYMGLPTMADNIINYQDSSVFKKVDNFKSHDFLLIHGSGDDNVHYQQSLMLAKVLQDKDILFEQMTYVDENHSIGTFTAHLYHTMEHFWNNYLSLDMDEDEI